MCNCNKGKTATSYTVKLPDGSTKAYSSEIEATAEAQRTGGTVIRR